MFRLRKHAGSIYKRLSRLVTHPYDVYSRKGSLFLLNRNSMMDEGLIKFKDYEDELVAQASTLIREHDLTHLVDIGANLGFYTVQLGKLPQISTITSFEPFPALFLQLGANVLINGLTEKWRGFQQALSDSNRIAQLHYHTYYLGTSSLDAEWKDRAQESIDVELVRLDDVLNWSGERCFVKVDVEGSEVAALRGMTHFLANNTIFLQVETNANRIPQVRSILEPLGFLLLSKIEENDYLFCNAERPGDAPPKPAEETAIIDT